MFLIAPVNIIEAAYDNWEATFYPSDNFTGVPVKKKYKEINFNWGSGSPDSKIPSDYFSAKFNKEFILDEGVYNLRVWANDGVRVYVDGKLYINQWNAKSLNFFAEPVYLKSGKHEIRIEYRELSGVAELRFEIDDLLRDNRWYGMAFSNPDLTGDTRLLGYKPQIPELDFNWGWGSPANNIPNDYFSTIFQREIKVDEGIYNLRVWANDGVQVYVDGKLYIDEWDNNQGLKFFAKPVYLEKGTHSIMIKHKELVGVAELRFEIDDLLRDNRWYGMAFSNPDLTGDTRLLGYKPQIPELDFNWGWGSPANNIPNDYFSTIFQREIKVDEGIYNLRVWANDGVQVYVDGKLYIDEWDNNQGLKNFAKPVYLEKGTHSIMIKHKELVGVAELRFGLNEVNTQNNWYGLAYSNLNFNGPPTPIDEKLSTESLSIDWGDSSPANDIPSDNFSVVLQKEINIEKGGLYNIKVKSDDEFQLYVDGELKLDKLNNNSSEPLHEKIIPIQRGKHKLVIKYKHIEGLAKLDFEIFEKIPEDYWYGLAYPSTDLTGSPQKIREEPKDISFNFNWGWGSPADKIPNDYFSTSFQRNINVDEGIYNLEVWANDGVRVYVDGELYIDEWENNQGLKYFNNPVHLTGGSHSILIMYKEVVGVAELRFDMTPVNIGDKWYGLAYPNSNLSGVPQKIGEIQSVDFHYNWGWGSPANKIPNDHFSTSFQRNINVDEGIYNLKTWANDGVRVYVDGNLYIDEWTNNQGLQYYDEPVFLKKGTHRITVEHREIIGVAELRFQLEQMNSETNWIGLAYPTSDLTGIPHKINEEPKSVNFHFNWGWGSAAGGIPSDNFSTIFQRDINLSEGIYNLRTWANDGIRVYVDGELYIDEWDNDQGLKFYAKPILYILNLVSIEL